MKEKIELTLIDFLSKFNVKYSVLEEKANLPKGTLALIVIGVRKPTRSRLKEIQKAVISLGSEMKNIKLIQDEDKSEV